MIEAIDMIGRISEKKINSTYSEQGRVGDHICYISDLRKLKSHFPEWDITMTLEQIIEDMVQSALSSEKRVFIVQDTCTTGY